MFNGTEGLKQNPKSTILSEHFDQTGLPLNTETQKNFLVCRIKYSLHWKMFYTEGLEFNEKIIMFIVERCDNILFWHEEQLFGCFRHESLQH